MAKTLIDNDYLINNFGYSLDNNLDSDLFSHLNSDIFLLQNYNAICDFIIENNINMQSCEDVELALDNTFKKDTFKRCQAIQAIFNIENGDYRYIANEEQNIAPAVKKMIKDTLQLFQRRRHLR